MVQGWLGVCKPLILTRVYLRALPSIDFRSTPLPVLHLPAGEEGSGLSACLHVCMLFWHVQSMGYEYGVSKQ